MADIEKEITFGKLFQEALYNEDGDTYVDLEKLYEYCGKVVCYESIDDVTEKTDES